ncbi:lytic transglycosylase domain-containing protein [Methylocystis bryophila]|uniref:Lytic transglycosylase n=1 Tax=Methylocystis bryophila TaxID=655015 RepID=A0A1W6N0C4_9HYPH|nr:transglycosylase SLT domain-containing protein [Methylocystis bryophila]ARN83249.1 lytic transglycosylase [Methylocystis bryophila]BDV39643.1 lytic transglycosylase [Methylocystis bryophila]
MLGGGPRLFSKTGAWIAGATVLALLIGFAGGSVWYAPEGAWRGWVAQISPWSAAPQSDEAAKPRGEESAAAEQQPESEAAQQQAEASAEPAAQKQEPLVASSELATLVGAEAEPFLAAVSAYRAGDFAAGDAAIAGLENPIAVTTAQWVGLKLHWRNAGFERLKRFVALHPNWPASDWLRHRAEDQLLNEGRSDATIKAFFSDRRPAAPAGKLVLARALARDGEFEQATALARELWREDDFGDGIEALARKEFAELLGPEDHRYRADRLFYAGRSGPSLRAAELAGKDAALLAKARAAASIGRCDAKMTASLPPALQKDPGLVFARVRYLRKMNKYPEAAAALREAPTAPEKLVDGEAWWTERKTIARKLLDKGDTKRAYEVFAGHAAKTASSQVEAEFHAGWIALRFMNDIDAAERHFDRAVAIAETPHQKSRAEYWRARAAEARQSPEQDEIARAHYREAATHSTTFYGQLALAKIGSNVSPVRPSPEPALGDARDESVRAVELLIAVGEKEAMSALASEAAKHLERPEQVAALAIAAERAHDARFSLTLGKLASYRGVAIDDAAFPTFGVPAFSALPGSAPKSLVFAVARQESAFDPHVVSIAGAVGLMQMLPSTARHTASLAHVGYDPHRLMSEPAFNAQLGASFLGELLGTEKGSYILTLAAYNAGPGRAAQWINAYGDPRHANVDPIDWVERIPLAETRNYVQRVLENFVVYRAKLGEETVRAPQMELARVGGAN